MGQLQTSRRGIGIPYANSLSILSPKPGVSTMVNAIRTPSSSSSEYHAYVEFLVSIEVRKSWRCVLTDVDWFDSDALFNVRSVRVVRNFMG